MGNFPKELKYTASHEWLRDDGDGIVTVGITDYAQEKLGDLVYVDLPSIKEHVIAGDEAVVLESVKTAADVYTPVSGTIIEINEDLEDAPSKVNQDPYGDGWLFRIKTEESGEFQELMDAAAYQDSVEE